MLELVLYESNQELIEKVKSNPLIQIICPSPVIADNLRNLLPDADVLTISRWTTDLLKKKNLERTKKSVLMLRLGAVWRNYFPEHKKFHFTEAFELFTELRSFTLDLGLLSEFFKELNEDMVKSLFIFWAFVDQEKIVDEHLGYFYLSDEVLKNELVFAGFKHMSGVQIDMLKKLGEQNQVEVFFPRSVYEDSLSGDWVKWIQDTELQIKEKNSFSLNTVLLRKGKINRMTNNFLKLQRHDIVLATTNVNIQHLQEIHAAEYSLKTSEDLFATKLEAIRDRLKDYLKTQSGNSCKEIQEYLREQNTRHLASADYRIFKVTELYIESLEIYKEFQDSLDEFGLELISEIVALNIPRTSLISLEKSYKNQIYDLNGLSFRENQKPLAVLATSGMGAFRASEKILSEEMKRSLKVIGPIKRAGLDFLFNKNEIIEILKAKENFLLIEEELLESDISWREILKDFNLKLQEYGVSEDKKLTDYLSASIKKEIYKRNFHSASSLQAYIDCPRKYYFSYITKIDNRPLLKSNLSSEELGKLEHKIIGEYFNRSGMDSDINPSLHQSLCVELFNQTLKLNHYELNRTDYARNLNEILHYSLNGIIFLKDYIKSHRAIRINFEKELTLNPWKLKGSIDCIVELPDSKIAVFDFKRSSAAAGAKYETLEFKKIQMWVYLITLNYAVHPIYSFGYINLSDIEDDKLIFSPEETIKLLEKSLDPAKNYMENILQQLESEIDFPAKPRELKVCQYCPVQLFCHRGCLS